MHTRISAVLLILTITGLVLFCGCTAPASPQTPVSPTHDGKPMERSSSEPAAVPHTAAQKETISEQLASVQSKNPVYMEAYRMFRNIQSTEYVHPPYTVDDAAGIYKFDCLGFVDHVLMNADMTSYKEIGKNVNPSIESYSAYFTKLDPTRPNALGWTKVPRPIDLRPGDVCLWLKSNTLDTGHMWIIAGEPKVDPDRTDEVLVRIFDSTGTVHRDDSRSGSQPGTGLGSGILGFMVNGEGNPAGLYWEGGESTGAGERDTTIICGRLTQ